MRKTKVIAEAIAPVFALGCFCVFVILFGCSSDSGSGDSPETQNISSSSQADCYYVPSEDGGWINLGEVSEENEVLPETEKMAREIFIATCNGDINITTTTTMEAAND